MNSWQQDITELMTAMEQDTPQEPIRPSVDLICLRERLITEEARETRLAVNKYCESLETNEPDSDVVREALAEVLDGFTDLLVVTVGGFVALGLNTQPFWDEVQRSNMSKLGEDGKPVKREDGKFLKGPNYSPPNLIGVLERAELDPFLMWNHDEAKAVAVMDEVIPFKDGDFTPYGFPENLDKNGEIARYQQMGQDMHRDQHEELQRSIDIVISRDPNPELEEH